MARRNPVRGNYVVVGTKNADLIRAGIRNVKGVLGIYAENTGMQLSVDPRLALWVTSRAVTSAAAKIATKFDLMSVPLNAVYAAIMSDPRAGFRRTEDQIVHMLGGETTENRAFAQDQMRKLEDAYTKANAA